MLGSAMSGCPNPRPGSQSGQAPACRQRSSAAIRGYQSTWRSRSKNASPRSSAPGESTTASASVASVTRNASRPRAWAIAGHASERERARKDGGRPLLRDSAGRVLGCDLTRGPQTSLAIVAIIPARYAATRLPGKPLSEIHGKTMIERVHERARAATRVDRVLVATDDERIAAAVRGFGGEAVLTSPAHAT